MLQPIIEVKHVSKTFVIQEPINTSVNWLLGEDRLNIEVQALKDVSFNVLPGDVLGIIGPNGAGKSTLLRLIGGMFTPTIGEIIVHGKIHALFELSSGFNAHLSGRQNIYQKAVLLGLSNEEIGKRFDEIVAFAELEDFIDEPLRTYSTGMQSRLAFALTTSIDADIFLIDEILAVGDEYFQGQCRRRIRNLIENGKSAIMVTHDLVSYLRLCNRGIYLEKGSVVSQGDPLVAGQNYISTFVPSSIQPANVIKILGVNCIRSEQELKVRVRFEVIQPTKEELEISIVVEKIDPLIGWETCLLEYSSDEKLILNNLEAGEIDEVTMILSPNFLTGKGRYYFSASIRPRGELGTFHPPYSSTGWTRSNFDAYFDIEEGTDSIYTLPSEWKHIVAHEPQEAHES